MRSYFDFDFPHFARRVRDRSIFAMSLSVILLLLGVTHLAGAQAPTIGETPNGSELSKQATETSQQEPSEEEEPASAASSTSSGDTDDVPDAPTPDELEQAVMSPAARAELGESDARSVGKPLADQKKLELAEGEESSVIVADQLDSTRNPNAEGLETNASATSESTEPMSTSSQSIGAPQAIADQTAGDRRPYLGLIAGSQSAKVTKVRERTAASLAGFNVGDVLLAVNDTPIKGFEEFLEVISKFQPGDGVDVVVQRRGRPTKLFVILGVKSSGR